MTTTFGFKAMNLDMTYRFKEGKTYKIDNNKPLELCTDPWKLYSDTGFHFCLNFEDIFNYYDWKDSRVFKIKTETEVLTKRGLSITKEITILEEVTPEEINLKELKSKYTKFFVINKADEKLIFNTFKDDEDWDIRKTLVEKLSDKKLLFNTFKDDKDWAVRFALAKKLSNKIILNTLTDDEISTVREIALTNHLMKNLFFPFLKKINLEKFV